MLPPSPMVTIKNRAGRCFMLFLTVVTLCAGCRPPGVRALLQGKKQLERGNYARAIEKLKEATASPLLRTNAQAWNYLGLACYHGGQAAEAERAYQRALALNHDLMEVHFNLGCLWLGQGRLDGAKTELTAYTLREGNSVLGLVQLGTVQLRLREFGAAEASFKEALRLSPQSVEALNGLGLVRFQRGRAGEGILFFNNALKQQPVYRPALLNLAIALQQSGKDRPLAAQKYREYLALKPAPANAAAVSATLRQLELELSPPTRPATPNPAAAANPNPAGQRPPATNQARVAGAARPEPASNLPKPAPTVAPQSPASPKVEVVALTAEPVFKSAQDVTTPSAPAQASADPPLATASLTPVPSSAPGRYAYRLTSRPAAGNRAEAERAFAQGVQAQKAQRMNEAAQAYRKAAQLDPSFYEAYFNLGLASAETGNLRTALTAYETALAIQPESADARYNFALVLRQANYVADAANELEKLLAKHPDEVRAHLALGNLYAQQLHQPARARQHYLKVLETDPHHPQAGAIRYWLTDNG